MQRSLQEHRLDYMVTYRPSSPRPLPTTKLHPFFPPLPDRIDHDTPQLPCGVCMAGVLFLLVSV